MDGGIMYKIQIILTYRDHIIYRFAKWLGVKWTHAAIRYRRSKSDDWMVFETAGFGTVHRTWDGFIKGVTEYVALETKIPLMNEQQLKLISFAWGNVGKFYNFPRLIWLALKILLGGRKPQAMYINSHVCSSFTDACYYHVGMDLVPREDFWVLPDDLYNSDKLKIISYNDKIYPPV